MGGFWSTLGTDIAQQSVPGRAAYQVATGKVLPPPQGQQANPGDALANAIIGKYKRESSSDFAPGSQNAPYVAPQPYHDYTSSVTPGQYPSYAPGSGPIADSEPSAPPSQWNTDTAPRQGGSGLLSMSKNPAAGGDAAASGTDALSGLAEAAPLIALRDGGMAGGPMMAKVGEAGPEAAGGRIISSPTIVKLNKGEAVVPLTPRASNKLQPDLLEGHVAAPKPPGIQYARYKGYGQGRGLMR